MANITKNVWTEYNGKKFGAAYAEYAQVANTDVAGNSLQLTIADGKVTEIGGKSISADITATSPIVKTDNNLSLDYDTTRLTTTIMADENTPIDSGDGPILATDLELVSELGGQELLARRAWEDEDGNNIKETYATKSDINSHAKASSLAPPYNRTTYTEGSYCTYSEELYKCNVDISVPEDWTPAHWTLVNVATIIGNIESLLAAL